MNEKHTDLPQWVIDKFREFGKKGGRPREVEHSDSKGCKCVECKKAAKGKPMFGRVKK
jgi:hypothetical protein